MIRYSVIIPQRDRADDFRRQLPALTATMGEFGEPYEIIVVDDASTFSTLRLLEKLAQESHALRLLRFDQARGVSVALSAGIRAARGSVLIAIEPGEGYPAHQITDLVSWLRRADLVAGRRRYLGLAKLWQRIARIPRWLLLGLDGHDPDCLFWAARREIFADLNLAAGTARYLPSLVARRGFRVCEFYVEHGGPRQQLPDVRPNPGDLLAVWWSCRRWHDQNALELSPAGTQPALRLVGTESSTPLPAAKDVISYPQQAKRA